MVDTVRYALKYRSMGFSIFPCIPPTKDERGKDVKKPRIEWTKFQTQYPDEKEIKNWFKKWPDSRIGIVTGKISNLFVVDVDSEEAREKLEAEYIPDSLPLPICKSPRGGYHYYFQHTNGLRNQTNIDGMALDTRGEGGFIMAPPSEGLNGNGYAWLKGCEIWKVPPAIMPESLYKYINAFSLSLGSNKNGNKRSQRVTKGNIIFTEPGRDETLFHLANHLVKGGMPTDNIREYLSFIAAHCEPPFPNNEVESKIQSALKRSDVREKSVAQEVRDFITVTKGNFRVTDVSQWVTSSNKSSNKSILMELSRLVKAKSVERIENRPGTYRKVDSSFETVDLEKIEDKEVMKLRLPFFMEQYVEIMPKDLIVYAGEPNAGKTALMLETVRLNMDKRQCWYFSTEMGRHNAKKRIGKHDKCFKWNFKFIDDFPNYFDVIKPDDFNFIDYVEVEDGEFYKIPSILAGIQKRLRDGIAFVALQKNPGTDYGVGGKQTLAKPALFCSLQPDYPGAIIKMVKAKNYIDANPNGYMHHFKIHRGINISPEGGWEPEM